MKTAELLQGDSVRLLDFGKTDLAYCRRLLSFGLRQGTVAYVVRRAPLGCPIQLHVKGIDFMLREREASHLLWERV